MAAIFSTAGRFTVQETPVVGGWQVADLHTGGVQSFGTDRVGALDHADWQNARAASAAKFARG